MIDLLRIESTKIFFGAVLWILIIFPLVLPFLIFLFLWKCVASLYAILLNSATTPSPLLSATNISDSMYCLSDPTTLIAYALRGEGFIDAAKLREHFYKTFIKDGTDVQYPVFHQTFTTILGYSYKIRASKPLDLCRHIRQEYFNPAQLEEETENQACLRIVKDGSHITGGNVPKWEIVLLHNGGKSTTLIFKISHALADAYSARTLLGLLTNNTHNYPISNSAKPKTFFQWVKIFAKTPILILQSHWNLAQSNFGAYPFSSTKRNRVLESRSTTNTCYWAKKTLEFSKIKEISKKTGCRITAIVSSLYMSTLKRTMGDLDATVQKETLGIFAFPAPTPHPAEVGQFCNHIVPGFVNLPLNEKNGLKQLETIHHRLEEYEGSETGEGIFLVQSLFGPLMPKFIIRGGMRTGATENRFLTFINPFIFSPLPYNILGVDCSALFYLCGIEQPINFRAMIFTPLTTGGNQLNMSVHGCQEIFQSQSDAELFMDNFMDEVELLLLEAGEGNGSKKEQQM